MSGVLIFADDNNFFFNRAFSSNPARNHPDNGLGVNFLFKPVAPFYVSTGFQDAQGQATTTGFDTFGDGDYFYRVEVGMAPKTQGYGQGNYWLTFEYTDPIDRLGKPNEKFIGVSLDQEIGAGVIPFFRYSWTQGNVTNVKYLVATGFGFSGPLGAPTTSLASPDPGAGLRPAVVRASGCSRRSIASNWHRACSLPRATSLSLIHWRARATSSAYSKRGCA